MGNVPQCGIMGIIPNDVTVWGGGFSPLARHLTISYVRAHFAKTMNEIKKL